MSSFCLIPLWAAWLPGPWGDEKENLSAFSVCEKEKERMKCLFTTTVWLKVSASKELHQGSTPLSAWIKGMLQTLNLCSGVHYISHWICVQTGSINAV